MSLKLNERYPGRFTNPSAGYPQGSFKNRTTPTSKDGSYLEKDWANDKEGFFQSLLAGAGIAPDGNVDSVGASQYYSALRAILGNYSAYQLVNTSISLVAGKMYLGIVSGLTLALPVLANSSSGDTVTVAVRLDATITVSGAGVINYPSVSSGTSISLRAGEQIQFVSNGTNAWQISNYSANPQYQASTAFSTGGTASALTLSPIPPAQAYVAPLRFRAKFSQASTPTTTINVSGLGTRLLKQYDSNGAKVPAVYAANQLSDIEYDGTDFVLLNATPPAVVPQNLVGVRGAFSELVGSATGTSALANFTAKELQVMSAAGAYKTLRNVNVSISLAASGLNGLDTGVSAISTWYYAYVIWNETSGVVGGIYSLSPAVPALPTGYTHSARVGAVRSDSTPANKYPLGFSQSGNRASYSVTTGTNVTAYPAISTGVGGNFAAGSLSAVSLSAFVPPTASAIEVAAFNTGGLTIVAASNNFGANNDVNNPPPLQVNPAGGAYSASTTALFAIKGSSIFWSAVGSQSRVSAMGWVDNL